MPERSRALALAALLALPGSAWAAPETRPVTDAERAAFHAWYQKRYPDAHAEQPRFIIERDDGTAAWRLAAVVERAPQRGYRQLCRMRRIAFRYANETRSWSAEERLRQFVWLNPAAGCAAPARPVELLARMPDTELAGVLGQQAPLLASARLLMAGNSACARQRALPFALSAIDVGAGGAGAEEMVALTYVSDRATEVTVWVRRSGADYSPWNVACTL